MILRPPISTRTDTPFPCTTLVRSHPVLFVGHIHRDRRGHARAIGSGGQGWAVDIAPDHPGTLCGHAMGAGKPDAARRSEEHTSELQSLMRISYAVFCLKTKTKFQYTSEDCENLKTNIATIAY